MPEIRGGGICLGCFPRMESAVADSILGYFRSLPPGGGVRFSPGPGRNAGSLPTPVGHGIVARLGELMLLSSVGEHRPDFSATAGGALEDDVASVGGPGRKVVAARFVRNLQVVLAGEVDYVNVVAAGVAGAVFAIPAEGQQLPIGRPGRADGIAAVSDALHIGAVDVHGVDLRQAGTSAHPGDLGTGARIEGGGDVGTLEGCELVQITAIRVRQPYLRIPSTRGGEGDLGCIGRPGRGLIASAG